jgi:hypothetical protein
MTTMPTELIMSLAVNLNMYEVLHLRTTCQKMRDILNVRVVKKMWIKRRKKIEQDLLQNRMSIVQGFNEARPSTDVGNTTITFKGDTRNFFKAMEENKRMVENAEGMKAEYKEAELKNYSYIKTRMSLLAKLRGENLWTIKNTEEGGKGILIVPRKIGHDYFCAKHDHFISYLLVEVILHKWTNGIKETLQEQEELPFKPTRMLPIYGSRRSLEKILQALDIYALGAIWTGEDGSWPWSSGSMYIPYVRCYKTREEEP